MISGCTEAEIPERKKNPGRSKRWERQACFFPLCHHFHTAAPRVTDRKKTHMGLHVERTKGHYWRPVGP